MTPRQIMKAVLTFRNPPRIGFALPKPYPNDFVGGVRKPLSGGTVDLEPVGNEKKRWRDEWGNIWANVTGMDRSKDKGEVVVEAIPDWSVLDSYQPPDLGRPEEYAQAAKNFADNPDKFRVGYIPGFTFSVARYMRKLENYLCDLVVEPERIARLHALVRAELLKAIDRLAEAGADAIMFFEDWGTQTALMVSPAMWRQIFKPEFVALAGRAHEHGMFVIMHSCGKMTAIIDDLIECGINCFQFDQPRLHGIEYLAEHFGGRASFYCPVDIQSTLQSRDPERIRADAKLMIEKLGCGGGFIAGYYASNEAIGLAPDIQDIACKAFVEFGGGGLV